MLLAALIATALFAPPAEARWSHGKSASQSDYSSFELGGRLMQHYDNSSVLSTPPRTGLIEMKYTYWYKGLLGLYLTAAKSVVGADTTALGVGLRVPFLTFFQNDSSVGRVRVMVVADFVRYDTATPVPPQSFDEVSWIWRAGGGIQWSIARTRFFLITAGMVSQISENFFVAPYAGLGVNF